jgi:DNA-binding transcriptional MerR regulator
LALLTFKELAESATIPESTLRVYRDEFEDYLPATGEGRKRRYGTEAAKTLQRIVSLKQEGKSRESIRAELSKTHEAQTPQTRVKVRTQETQSDAILLQLTALQQEIVGLRVEVAALREAVHLQISVKIPIFEEENRI